MIYNGAKDRYRHRIFFRANASYELAEAMNSLENQAARRNPRLSMAGTGYSQSRIAHDLHFFGRG
jgi:hypothetical protein